MPDDQTVKRPEAERPDEPFIEATAKHLEEVWDKARAKWKNTDTFLDGTFVVWDAEDPKQADRPVHRPAKARAIVDHAVDTQLPYEPQFDRDPVNKSETQEDAANMVENWAGAVWTEASRLETSLPAKGLARHLVQYGYGVLEGPYVRRTMRPTRESNEEEEEYEERLAEWFPFRMRAIHPARVLLPPYEKRPGFAIKRVSHYGHDLAGLTYEKRRRSKKALVDIYDYGKAPWGLVPTIEYFSKRWHALMVASEKGFMGRLLYVEVNTDGFTPFSHGFSGWGGEPTDMEEIDPSHLAQGILDPAKDSLVRDAQRKSALHNMLINMSFPPLVTRKDPGETVQEIAAGVVQGEEGDISWLKFPDAPNWSFREGEEIERDIEEGTFSLMQAGFNPQGVERVGQLAILMQKSNLKFQALTRQMEDMASEVSQNFLRQADRMDVIPVVSGQKISHDDIGRRYHLRATFELVDPVLQLQQEELSMRAFQLGLDSREGVWKIGRKRDTTTLKRQLIEDMVYKMPAVAAEMVKETMIRLGLGALAERLAAEEAAAKMAMLAAQGNGAGSPVPLPSEEPQNPAQPRMAADTVRQMRKPLTTEVPGQPRVPPSARP